MTQTAKAVSLTGVTRTLELTTEPQDLFSILINCGTVDISMKEGGADIGTLKIIVGGDIAKNDVSTGGQYFDQEIDNTRFPISYSANSNEKNYCVKLDYDLANKKILVSKEINDPELIISFTATFISSSESYPNSVHRVDKIVENTEGQGVAFDNVVKLNGGVEMSSLPSDTITFSTSDEFITYTNVSSKATRIGKICNVVVKATLAVDGALLAVGSVHDFFSITPTDPYRCSYVNTATVVDGTTMALGALYNDANTADFKLVLPRSMSNGTSTTVYVSMTYVSS